MKTSDLIKKLDLKICSNSEEKEIMGCYTGDLLSRVMSKAKKGDAWVTIMNNVNVAAVASLTEVSCVILADGIFPDKELLNKAKSQEINLFTSEHSAAKIIIEIGKLL